MNLIYTECIIIQNCVLWVHRKSEMLILIHDSIHNLLIKYQSPHNIMCHYFHTFILSVCLKCKCTNYTGNKH
jgi:hypothetical protein